MEDHDGNTIEVGYTGYLPFTVTAIGDNGTVTVKSGYSEMTVAGVPGADVHKGEPPTWPALP